MSAFNATDRDGSGTEESAQLEVGIWGGIFDAEQNRFTCLVDGDFNNETVRLLASALLPFSDDGRLVWDHDCPDITEKVAKMRKTAASLTAPNGEFPLVSQVWMSDRKGRKLAVRNEMYRRDWERKEAEREWAEFTKGWSVYNPATKKYRLVSDCDNSDGDDKDFEDEYAFAEEMSEPNHEMIDGKLRFVKTEELSEADLQQPIDVLVPNQKDSSDEEDPSSQEETSDEEDLPSRQEESDGDLSKRLSSLGLK